jgi:hypothetical protein
VKRKGKEKKEEQREGVWAGFGSLLGWIGSWARPKLGCWLSLLNFFCAVSFLIFCFLFLSQILHIEFKQGQTNF